MRDAGTIARPEHAALSPAEVLHIVSLLLAVLVVAMLVVTIAAAAAAISTADFAHADAETDANTPPLAAPAPATNCWREPAPT